MDESVKTESLPSEKKENNSGLQLNKKSIALILVLLTVILAFAGVLTQVMPRGEYYTYPENTYKLSDGTFVTLQTDSEFTVDKTEKMRYNSI